MEKPSITNGLEYMAWTYDQILDEMQQRLMEKNSDDETYTDESGNWSLALREGVYTLKFRKYGYTFEDKKIVVTAT